MTDDERVGPTLYDEIQATATADNELDGAVLMGYVLIAEWSTPNTERWLSKVTWSAAGKCPPAWQVDGYLHHALFEGWPALDEIELDEADDDGDDEG